MSRTIVVRYFASLADRAGTATERVEVAVGDDVASLWSELARRHPKLSELATRPLAACDLEQSGWDRRLDDVGEVAFLPPFSGG